MSGAELWCSASRSRVAELSHLAETVTHQKIQFSLCDSQPLESPVRSCGCPALRAGDAVVSSSACALLPKSCCETAKCGLFAALAPFLSTRAFLSLPFSPNPCLLATSLPEIPGLSFIQWVIIWDHFILKLAHI